MLNFLQAQDIRRPIQRTQPKEVATVPPVELLPVPVVTVEKAVDNKMGEVTKFTRADVATRNGKGGAAVWIIVRDQVYDCTNYLHEHPGGFRNILWKAGKDATKAYDSAAKHITSPMANTDLAKLRIGEIVEHPGGDASILEEAGKECTKAFDNSGHTADAHTIMAKYKIGEIVEEEKYYDANGKKKKRVVSAPPEDGGGRSCMSIVCCGLIG